MNLPPCKDCPNREIGCHSQCKKYIKFKNDLKKDKAKEKAEKKMESFILEGIIESTKRRR